jgi:RNase P subunit RPR2
MGSIPLRSSFPWLRVAYKRGGCGGCRHPLVSPLAGVCRVKGPN